MIFIAKFISIVLIVSGCFAVMQPAILRRLLYELGRENMPYAAAIIMAVSGIMLVGASSSCRIAWFMALIGWAIVLAGIIMLVVKKEMVSVFIRSLENQQEIFYKRAGIALLCTGVLMVYAV
jgi:hypothetical protein